MSSERVKAGACRRGPNECTFANGDEEIGTLVVKDAAVEVHSPMVCLLGPRCFQRNRERFMMKTCEACGLTVPPEHLQSKLL